MRNFYPQAVQTTLAGTLKRALSFALISLCPLVSLDWVAASADAPPSITLSRPSAHPVDLGLSAESWREEDLQHLLKRDSIRPRDLLTPPIPGQRSLFFGYASHFVWIRVPFRTAPDLTSQDWVLFLNQRGTSFEVTLFTEEGQTILSEKKVQSLTKSEVDLQFKPNQNYILIVRSPNTSETALSLSSPEQQAKANALHNVGLGLYFGGALVLFLFNFFAWIALRDGSYVYYLIYIAGIIATMAIFNGVIPRPDLTTTAAMAAFLGAILFCDQFLKLRLHAPRIRILLFIFATIAGVVFVATLMPHYQQYRTPFEYASDFALFAGGFTMTAVSISLALRKHVAARYYAFSWLIFFGGVSAYLFRYYFYSGTSQAFNYFILQQTSLIQMILLTFALMDHMKTLRVNAAIALERAKETELLRTFIRVISHDILNPLTAIMNCAGLNARDGHPHWALTLRSAKTIQAIINQARHARSLGNESTSLKMSSIRLTSVIDNVSATFEGPLQRKQVTLQITDTNPDLMVEVDPTALEVSVLNNLISNALKFSHRGGTISLRITENDAQAIITVSDQGIGIPPSLRDQLFCPESNTSRCGTAGEHGSGFGMPLVKQMVEMMGGTIMVESHTKEEGNGPAGTTFTLSFPKSG